MQARREEVNSSMMAAFGYDEAAQVLEVEMNSGKIYRYKDVPLEEVDGLRSASSKGVYFNKRIRNNPNYRAELVN